MNIDDNNFSNIKGPSLEQLNEKKYNKKKESQINSQNQSTLLEISVNEGKQDYYEEAPKEDILKMGPENKNYFHKEGLEKNIYKVGSESNNVAFKKGQENNIFKMEPENKNDYFKEEQEKDTLENKKNDYKKAQEKKKFVEKINYLKKMPKHYEVIDFNYSLLEPLFQNIDTKRENIILLTTGSFNPIHRMHLEILNIAYKYLLNLNKYNIICGFISPSADCYVINKQPPLIQYDLRCKMIEKAIEEYNNENKDNNNLEIFIHKWEGTHDYFIDFPEVIDKIQYQLDEYFKGIKIKLVYVCGMDLFLKCHYYFTKNVIAIDRKPYKNNKFKSNPKKIFYLIEDDKSEPFSSTDIRKAYKIGDFETIKTTTFPEVADMVIEFYNEYFK